VITKYRLNFNFRKKYQINCKSQNCYQKFHQSQKKNKNKNNSRTYYQKKIKTKNIKLNLLKKKFKIAQRNQNQHLRMLLMISKTLKKKFFKVLKNK